MTIEELISRYYAAWNSRDADAALGLMHPGAAYYDAFWMETCVGRDLQVYLRDALAEEQFWYERAGDIITTPHGIIGRYDAHEYSAGNVGDVVFNGFEIFRVHDGRILTVSNFYCSPVEADLVELAELTAVRHGLTRHANDGLSALVVARIRKRLSACLDDDRIYLDPDTDRARLAEIIHCTPEQLGIVLENHFRTDLGNLLDRRRIEYAKQLLLDDHDNPRFIEDVASAAGFRSARKFSNRFAEIVGVTPKAYRRRERYKARSS